MMYILYKRMFLCIHKPVTKCSFRLAVAVLAASLQLTYLFDPVTRASLCIVTFLTPTHDQNSKFLHDATPRTAQRVRDVTAGQQESIRSITLDRYLRIIPNIPGHTKLWV